MIDYTLLTTIELLLFYATVRSFGYYMNVSVTDTLQIDSHKLSSKVYGVLLRG